MSAPDDPHVFSDGTPLPPEPMDAPPRVVPIRPDAEQSTVPHAPDDADDLPVPVLAPPQLSGACYHGPLGEVVRLIAPHTEADPAAMLAQVLAMFGCLVGDSPFIKVSNVKHRAIIWPLLVGESGMGAKGTSMSAIREPFERVFPTIEQNVSYGIGSGEGLIDLVHDGEGDDPDARGFVEGVLDKRRIVEVQEFVSLLNKVHRDGSTLGTMIRLAWDGAPLEVKTKLSTLKATGHHIALIGHATPDELMSTLRPEDFSGGMMNRFLPIHSRATKALPEGGNTPPKVVDEAAARLAQAKEAASTIGEVTLSGEALTIWKLHYTRLRFDHSAGTVGKLTARAAPYVMRIALIYATADGSSAITGDHMDAALHLWEYVEATARWMYSTAAAEERASEESRLVDFLDAAGPDGVTKWQITNELYKRNKKSREVDAILSPLIHSGRIEQTTIPTTGRPKTVYRLVNLEGI